MSKDTSRKARRRAKRRYPARNRTMAWTGYTHITIHRDGTATTEHIPPEPRPGL
jgi:outer membrane biosynthesis protein TonB